MPGINDERQTNTRDIARIFCCCCLSVSSLRAKAKPLTRKNHLKSTTEDVPLCSVLCHFTLLNIMNTLFIHCLSTHPRIQFILQLLLLRLHHVSAGALLADHEPWEIIRTLISSSVLCFSHAIHHLRREDKRRHLHHKLLAYSSSSASESID